MEGRVYVCSWKAIPAGYAVWVKARPAVRAEGATFEKADEALYDPILAAYGDGENVREYDPPPPVRAGFGEFLQEGLVAIVGNATAPVPNLEELYEGGVCHRCRAPRGASARASSGGESIGRNARGVDIDAIECDVCGHHLALTLIYPHELAGFVCEADLARPRPSCFAVGPAHAALLALSRDRWRALVNKPGTRGLMSYNLGVVGTDRCDRNPPRRLMDAKRR
jgi:hypothetical protein